MSEIAAGSIAGLVPEFRYTATLKAPVMVGPGAFGTRIYFEVTGGEVTGERINGRFGTGGGDWILVGPDGLGRLDVRGTIETTDGAVLYLQYGGVLEMNDAVNTAMQNKGGTDFGDQYFRTAPRIETGDPRYQWATQCVFVGEGRIVPGGVEYIVSRVT